MNRNQGKENTIEQDGVDRAPGAESFSFAEKELTSAHETGDIRKIAAARAKLNEAKLEQLQLENLMRVEQQKQVLEARRLAQKEKGADLYSEYLKTGKLSDEQLRTLVSLDKSLSDFDKTDFRLEAIERVRKGHSNVSLDNYQSLLESVRMDPKLTADLLDAEYYQMSVSVNQVKQQRSLAADVELVLE